MNTHAAASTMQGIISGDRHLGKAELDEQVSRVAGGLNRAGIGQGDCVAILMRNDIPFLTATLAAIRLGAYAVPINWHFKADEIAYVLSDCGAKVLIAHADLLTGLGLDAFGSDRAGAAVPASVKVISVAVPPDIAAAYGLADTSPVKTNARVQDWDAWVTAAQPYTGPPRRPTQSMIYTSGTTGRPKGVRRQPPTPEQEQAIARSRQQIYGFGPYVRTLIPGPLYHSAPNGLAIRAVAATDLVVLMARFEPEAFLAAVERHRITTLFMVPTMFVRLLKLPESVRRRYDISSLRFVMHAAAPCPPDVKRAMIEWFGPIVWEFYGGTEIGAITVISSEEWLRKPGSVGRLVEGATVAILDEAGQPVETGAVGEVFTRVAFYLDFTYHNQPDKRAEVDRGGLITGGDVGYLDADGYLFLCDRKRDMVISGGVNIYPAEIEAVAVTIPGVKDCAVFGVPDEEFGEQLMAFVEPMEGITLDPDEFRAYLGRHLASYKVPRKVEVRLDLPREDSGKIFKRRLREPYWQNAGRKI